MTDTTSDGQKGTDEVAVDDTAPGLSNEQCLSIISQMLEKTPALPQEHRLASAAMQTLYKRLTDA